MDIKILKIDNMINNGENILKNLQNSVIDDLDLLVRESIQNSLDAGYYKKNVEVDFTIGKFNKSKLINKLQDTESLNRLYKNDYEDYISIKDLNTSGLTGPLSYKEVEDLNEQGNLLRLVYSMGNPQTQSGAGGSWGLGKTLYYRIGTGIVIYYSRIKVGNNYEERLVGVLVENQNGRDTVINHKKHRSTGIAWWGEYKNDELLPIRNSEKIKEILDIFSIDQFKGNETGTNIIIPFIDKEKLYDEAVMNNENANNFYMGEITEYLKYSVQRWYFPRLNNPNYQIGKKNNLTVRINGEKIDTYNEDRFFKILRKMYNYAITGKKDNTSEIFNNETLKREEINVSRVPNMNGNLVGHLVFAKFDYKELGMSTSFNISNPIFLSNTNKDPENENNSNPPMILYTRMPGMIVNYDSTNNWVSGLEHTAQEDYIIGIFVLNSDDDISFDIYGEHNSTISLENYIRSTELDDHMEWNNKILYDRKNKSYDPNIVGRIIRNTKNKIKSSLYLKEENGTESDVTSHLGTLIGGLILPPIGYGTGSNNPGPGRGSGGSGSGKKPKIMEYKVDIKYDYIKYEKNSITIPFEFEFLKDEIIEIEIEVLIVTDTLKLTLNQYEQVLVNDTPLSLEKLTLNTSNVIVKKSLTNESGLTSKYHVKRIDLKTNYIKGEVTIRTTDKNIVPEVKIRGKKENE